MYILKYIGIFLIIILSGLIGKSLSKKYIYRLEELEELKNDLNVFKSKIKFTYEPIPEIFNQIIQINKNNNSNVSTIFKKAIEKMKYTSASLAWQDAVDETFLNFTKEDKKIIKTLSKLLGQTDIEGQISQIELTQNFLDKQIKDAELQKNKNEKLYNKLGITIGFAIAIILV